MCSCSPENDRMRVARPYMAVRVDVRVKDRSHAGVAAGVSICDRGQSGSTFVVVDGGVAA